MVDLTPSEFCFKVICYITYGYMHANPPSDSTSPPLIRRPIWRTIEWCASFGAPIGCALK